MGKLHIERAIVVEGRDDVTAVEAACEALVIATHGFGISKETWQVIEKAYNEKGLIILTDPDHAGEEIRRRLTEKFPEAVQAYMDRKSATDGSDIGIENADPADIKEALTKALELHGRFDEVQTKDDRRFAEMKDLAELGLSGGEGSSEKRALVCKELGIGYANASAMIKKLRGFGIDLDELKEATSKIK